MSEESLPSVRTPSPPRPRSHARSGASTPTRNTESTSMNSETLPRGVPQLALISTLTVNATEDPSLKSDIWEIWVIWWQIPSATLTCVSWIRRFLFGGSTLFWVGQWWFTLRKTIWEGPTTPNLLRLVTPERELPVGWLVWPRSSRRCLPWSSDFYFNQSLQYSIPRHNYQTHFRTHIGVYNIFSLQFRRIKKVGITPAEFFSLWFHWRIFIHLLVNCHHFFVQSLPWSSERLQWFFSRFISLLEGPRAIVQVPLNYVSLPKGAGLWKGSLASDCLGFRLASSSHEALKYLNAADSCGVVECGSTCCICEGELRTMRKSCLN